MRVDRLETWAGPGQAEAFAGGLRLVRSDLAKVRQTQDRHTQMLAALKDTMREILARLPKA